MSPVILTGAGSYTGRTLAKELAARGISVLAVDYREQGFKADVFAQATAVIHLAHPAGDHAVTDAVQMANDLVAVLPASARLVFASSVAVYGEQPYGVPIPEQAESVPLTLNGKSKKAAEEVIRGHDNHIILRISSLWGEAAQKYAAGDMLSRLHNHMPVELSDNGLLMRDFIHVDDVSRTMIEQLNTAICGTFNLGSGHVSSMYDFVKALKTHVQSCSEIVLAEKTSGAVLWAVPDITRAREQLRLTLQERF